MSSSVATTGRPVLSHYQANTLRSARERGATAVQCSLDLGRTEVTFQLDSWGVRAGEALGLEWSVVERIAESDSVCFVVDNGEASPIRTFSEESGYTLQLWPTEGPPALLISGFVMHRVRDVGPFQGAERMVRALGTVRGRLLDTTTGLGYAAIVAARTAQEVVTIEVEPAVREIARMNPWSRELFERPNLKLEVGNSAEVVKTLDPASFSAVFHDPPAINLAGELYSAEFYADVKRVLTRSGKFFHYIGDPESASGGRTTRGVVKRLREVGFSRVTVREEAFGVLAVP